MKKFKWWYYPLIPFALPLCLLYIFSTLLVIMFGILPLCVIFDCDFPEWVYNISDRFGGLY